MPVEQVMFEAVLEAAQTPVAGPVAVGRTVFEETYRLLEQRSTQPADPAREASATGQGVIDIDLRFKARVAAWAKRGPVLRLEFSRLDLQPLGRCDGKGLGHGPQRPNGWRSSRENSSRW